MKLFLDSAITDEIKKYYNTGLIDGVTTNPTLIYKSGRDPEDVYQELIDIGIPDISMEVVGDENTMIGEGRRLIKKFGNRQSTIKVPCTVEGLAACRALSDEGARVNVTLIFSLAQSILAFKSGATYISPFVGRVDDNSFNGLELIKEITGGVVFYACWFKSPIGGSSRDVRRGKEGSPEEGRRIDGEGGSGRRERHGRAARTQNPGVW